MDVLRYKTVTGTDGASTVSTGGLNLAQIIKVSRQGIQHDYSGGLIAINELNRQFAFLSWNKRIVFNSLNPFVGDEVIHIIYKVTT